jgi:hypothetical protein
MVCSFATWMRSHDELLSAVDVVRRTRDGRVDHEVNASAAVRAGPDWANRLRQRGAPRDRTIESSVSKATEHGRLR